MALFKLKVAWFSARGNVNPNVACFSARGSVNPNVACLSARGRVNPNVACFSQGFKYTVVCFSPRWFVFSSR